MTDHNNHLPFDIQIEILNRLPVKSLIQFRSVSKAWKTLIDSKEFITGHSLRHTHPQQLTVLYYKDDLVLRHKYLTFLDDQTFPRHRFVPTFPQSVEELYSPRIVGSSQGLLCWYGFCTDPNSWSVNHKAVIWNPSIRKAVMPDVCFSWYDTVIGFGVSPVTGDPTIVEISGDKYMSSRVVRVFRLSTGAWINLSNNLPKQPLTWSQVVVDKFIYLLGYNRITETETTNCNLILSFDMTNDKFGVVELPEHLALKTDEDLVISKLQESLVVLEYSLDSHVCDVWVMENGVHTSFKKLFTIKEPNAIIRIVGFNKSGYPLMEIGYVGEELQETALSFYDPASEQIIDLGINGREDQFYMNTYAETLLLLDQRDSSI